MPKKKPTLLLSCEHGGNEIPKEWRHLFAGIGPTIDTHRGLDIGALDASRAVARNTKAPLFYSKTTRLLVDLNRELRSSTAFSEFTKPLPKAERERLVSEYWKPHRDRVENWVRDHLSSGPIVHIAIHSFTPVFDGLHRPTDIGLLYDPSRAREKDFCGRWRRALIAAEKDDEYLVHCNAPYRGVSDSLPTSLRKRIPQSKYLGLEVELNQKFAEDGGPPWARLKRLVSSTLKAVLAEPL
jgi:predicted N-formylglutamate amidohydrolase